MHKTFKEIQLKWQLKLEHISDKSIYLSTGFNYKVVLIVRNTGFQWKAHIIRNSLTGNVPA